MPTNTRLTPPEADRQRHRIFDLVVLPILALVTIGLIVLAITG